MAPPDKLRLTWFRDVNPKFQFSVLDGQSVQIGGEAGTSLLSFLSDSDQAQYSDEFDFQLAMAYRTTLLGKSEGDANLEKQEIDFNIDLSDSKFFAKYPKHHFLSRVSLGLAFDYSFSRVRDTAIQDPKYAKGVCNKYSQFDGHSAVEDCDNQPTPKLSDYGIEDGTEFAVPLRLQVEPIAYRYLFGRKVQHYGISNIELGLGFYTQLDLDRISDSIKAAGRSILDNGMYLRLTLRWDGINPGKDTKVDSDWQVLGDLTNMFAPSLLTFAAREIGAQGQAERNAIKAGTLDKDKSASLQTVSDLNYFYSGALAASSAIPIYFSIANSKHDFIAYPSAALHLTENIYLMTDKEFGAYGWPGFQAALLGVASRVDEKYMKGSNFLKPFAALTLSATNLGMLVYFSSKEHDGIKGASTDYAWRISTTTSLNMIPYMLLDVNELKYAAPAIPAVTTIANFASGDSELGYFSLANTALATTLALLLPDDNAHNLQFGMAPLQEGGALANVGGTF